MAFYSSTISRKSRKTLKRLIQLFLAQAVALHLLYVIYLWIICSLEFSWLNFYYSTISDLMSSSMLTYSFALFIHSAIRYRLVLYLLSFVRQSLVIPIADPSASYPFITASKRPVFLFYLILWISIHPYKSRVQCRDLQSFPSRTHFHTCSMPKVRNRA